jgi:hypothetical protein
MILAALSVYKKVDRYPLRAAVFPFSVDLDALSARCCCFVSEAVEHANHSLASCRISEPGIADSNITLFMHDLRRHLTFGVDKLKIESGS